MLGSLAPTRLPLCFLLVLMDNMLGQRRSAHGQRQPRWYRTAERDRRRWKGDDETGTTELEGLNMKRTKRPISTGITHKTNQFKIWGGFF